MNDENFASMQNVGVKEIDNGWTDLGILQMLNYHIDQNVTA